MALMVLLIGMLLLSFAVFYAERGDWSSADKLWLRSDSAAGGSEASPVPSMYQSVGVGLYYTIVTLSTVRGETGRGEAGRGGGKEGGRMG